MGENIDGVKTKGFYIASVCCKIVLFVSHVFQKKKLLSRVEDDLRLYLLSIQPSGGIEY